MTGFTLRTLGVPKPIGEVMRSIRVKCLVLRGLMSERVPERKLVSMAEVIICSAAEVDYTESLCWYSERDLDVAKDFDEEFDRAISQIAADPERFPTCDTRHRFFLMRRFPFQIIYRIRDDKVMIIAVAHTSREPDYWSQR